MATYAVLKNNTVDNIIVANTLEDAELVTNATCIEYTDENPACIGYIYANGVFTAPVIEETPAE